VALDAVTVAGLHLAVIPAGFMTDERLSTQGSSDVDLLALAADRGPTRDRSHSPNAFAANAPIALVQA